jgi:hypothetical protein
MLWSSNHLTTTPTTMYNRFAVRAALLIAAIVGGTIAASSELSAQFEPVPRRSSQFLATAENYARENLPSDAVLALVGAIGNVEVGPGIPLAINADSGTASAWAYIYYTPSQTRWISVAVFELPGMGEQVMESDPPTVIPQTLTRAVDLTLPYAESGRMAERLKQSPDYQIHRELYPGARPSIVSYRDPVAADAAGLPNTFPSNAPLWSIEYSGGGDSAMICWVSGSSGQSWCVQGRRAAVVRDDDAAKASVFPTPAADAVRVTTARRIGAGNQPWLVDANGTSIAAARRIECATEGCVIEFDVSALADGVYFVRRQGETLGRVVVAR